MGQKYLIDTCAVVKYLDELLPQKALSFLDDLVDEDCKVSFITKIELLVWNPPIAEDIKIREEFLAGSEIHFINDRIINLAIQIRKITKKNFLMQLLQPRQFTTTLSSYQQMIMIS